MTLRPHGPQHARLPCPLLFSGVSSECHRGLFSSEVLCRTFVCSVTQSCPALCDSARQAPLTMGAPRQEHWSGWPFPSPGDLFNPGIKLSLLHRQADSLTTEPPGKSVERVTPICSSHSSSILRGSGRKGSHDRLQQTEVEEAFSHSAGPQQLEAWSHDTPPAPPSAV